MFVTIYCWKKMRFSYPFWSEKNSIEHFFVCLWNKKTKSRKFMTTDEKKKWELTKCHWISPKKKQIFFCQRELFVLIERKVFLFKTNKRKGNSNKRIVLRIGIFVFVCKRKKKENSLKILLEVAATAVLRFVFRINWHTCGCMSEQLIILNCFFWWLTLWLWNLNV